MSYESVRRKFLFQVNEFYREKNLQKFNQSNKTIKFKNGTCMSRWFKNNRKEIFESNEEICKKVQEQYKKYKEYLYTEQKRIRFVNKLEEFYGEKDLQKFNSNNKMIRFANGTCKGTWFRDNKKHIFSSDDELCLEVLRQYCEYKNKPDMIIYVDDRLKNINKKKAFVWQEK